MHFILLTMLKMFKSATTPCKDLISGVVYKFQRGLCSKSYYCESVRHLDIRSGEHIGVSPLTGKKVKPLNNSAICDHFRVLFVIIYSTVIFYPLLTTLVY